MRKPVGGGRLSFIPPMVPKLLKTPPKGDDWIHEVNHDGYRTHLSGTATASDFSPNAVMTGPAFFAELAAEATATEADSFILEGETIKINAAGLADLNALQKAVGTGKVRDIYRVALRLLHLNGKDLRDEPVERRREIFRA